MAGPERLLGCSMVLLAALTAGACHRRSPPPPPAAAALPRAPVQAPPVVTPRPLRSTVAAAQWEPDRRIHQDPGQPPAARAPQSPPAIPPMIYDTTPGRLPMWRQRAKHY
jgi:hypothetical protein